MSVCPAPVPARGDSFEGEAPRLHLVGRSAPASPAAAVRLGTRLIGFLRRLARDIAHPDGDDMTPECMMTYAEAIHSTVERFDITEARQRLSALEACVPLLFNIRVPSARIHFARELIALCPEFAARSETFMLRLMEQVEAYGQGFPPQLALEFVIVG